MTVPFSEFQKLDLRIAKILAVDEMEGYDKIYKLTVDLGGPPSPGGSGGAGKKRTILAGIKQNYEPYDLLGKEIVVVANLEPRTIGGETSEGMLLAAEDGKKIVLLGPWEEVEPGSPVS